MLNSKCRWTTICLGLILQFWQTDLCAQRWEVINEMSGSHWQDAYFVDEKNGWMVGFSPSKILHTSDGGVFWEEQFRFEKRYQNPSVVKFVDANHGWVVGSPDNFSGDGLIFSTDDGGKHWKKQNGPHGIVTDVHFVDQKNGWIVGILNPGDGKELGHSWSIYHSRDGGVSWQRQWQGNGFLHTVFFLNDQIGWTMGAESILSTQDGGVTWKENKLNIFPSLPAEKWVIIQKILYLDHQTGWAVGYYGEQGWREFGGRLKIASLVLHTIDGGKNWKIQYEGKGDRAAWDLYFFNSQEGWVVGSTFIGDVPLLRGFVLHTKDGGRSWERYEVDEPVHSIHFTTPEKGFLVGLHNAMLKTTDGGKSWILQKERGYQLTDVVFRPEHGSVGGWISGNRFGQHPIFVSLASLLYPSGMTKMLQTKDFGQTWDQVSEFSSEFQSLYFHDHQRGIAVGWQIDKTEDGGKTWTKLHRSKELLTKIDFATPEQGVAIGKKGLIYLTLDGGATWEQLRKFTDADLFDVQFIDRKEGWISGWDPQTREGLILHTANGGKNWDILAKLERAPFALDMLDSKIGWAVGSEGKIWHSRNGGTDWQLQTQLTGNHPHLYDVLFLDASRGWAVGTQGIIVSTTDGGKTWQKQNSGTDMDLNRIAYNQKDSLVIVGSWNTVLRYQDNSLLRYAQLPVESNGKLLTKLGLIKSELYQNFPNPFNPETWIPYQLATESEITVFIYNSQGQLVRQLKLGRQSMGVYLTKEQAVYWDGKNDNGELVSSGIYFYTLQAGSFQSTKRMILLK